MTYGISEKKRMNRKYKLDENGSKYVSEFLKQKIKTGSEKIKRYDKKNLQYHQNNQFRVNQKSFFKDIDGQSQSSPPPESQEAKEFWSSIWAEKTETQSPSVMVS